MQFHLDYNPPVDPNKISHNDEVLFIGSCFSEHISQRLLNLKFKVASNPFGIVFNPKSIEISLNRIIDKKYFKDSDVFEKEDSWFTLEAHSLISASTKNELLERLNQTIDEWYQKIQIANTFIITFGSAFAYRAKSNNEIAANCHKLPANQFEKELIETSLIVSTYQILIEKLKKNNPKLNILFTVSPVKHLRDGVVENSLSKAILIQTVHQIIKQNSNCAYFPAYELVNDDLRDYRFYEADMAHPNKQAIEYVWQKFSNCFFAEETHSINQKLQEIVQALNHKPFNSTSVSHQKFLVAYKEKCLDLKSKYPQLNLDTEIKCFSNNI